MAIEFICPVCQGTLRVGDDAVGRVVRCGSCLTALRVPETAAESAPEPEAEPARPKPVEPLAPPRPQRPRDDDYDEYGEPRRRRRSADTGSKKTGHSVLFWLVIIAAGLGFLTCLTCGGIWLALATPRWFTHESPEGEYKVELPARPNPAVAEQAKLKHNKPNEHVDGTLLVGRAEAYWVWYADIDPQLPRGRNDDALLRLAVDGLKNETPGVTILRETPKTVDGLPAMEIVATLPDGSTNHCLVVVGKHKMYIAAVGGPFITPEGNDRVRRFLDSFHVIPGKGGNPWRGNKKN